MISLPVVPDSSEDVLRLGLIEHLAINLQEAAGKAVVAVTGGSALRLRYGLTRPSFDLDLDVSTRLDWLKLARKAVMQSRWGTEAIVDQKQGGRGYIRINVRPKDSAPWQTKVDVRLCDGASHAAITESDCAVIDGLSILALPLIAARKREKLMGENFREQGRDLYDYAWLVAQHPSAISVRDRLLFRRWLLEWSDNELRRWRFAIAADRALSGVDVEAVIKAAYAAVETDAGIQFADAQQAENAVLSARILPNGMFQIGYTHPSSSGEEFVSLGEFRNDDQALRFAMAHELDSGRGANHVRQLLSGSTASP